MDNNHTHNHTQEHTHNHGHEHTNSPAMGCNFSDSPDERLALLNYMVAHNKHHTIELTELAKGTCGEACNLIMAAIDSYTEGNRLLEEALSHMNN